MDETPAPDETPVILPMPENPLGLKVEFRVEVWKRRPDGTEYFTGETWTEEGTIQELPTDGHERRAE